MPLFASLLALLFGSHAGSHHGADSVPSVLAARVAGAVARQWGDDSATVRLQWMALPPAATFPPGSDVRLMGRGDGGWFSVVFTLHGAPAFAVRVRAGALDSVIVTTRTVTQGATLTTADIRNDTRLRWGPPTPADHPGPGWIVRRQLLANTTLSAADANPPMLVHVGDSVQLQWHRGNVVVALDGTALGAGGLGQPVRVRLSQRGGERSGIVIAAGIVRLDS